MSKKRGSLTKECAAPMDIVSMRSNALESGDIADLYQRVRKSHALFQLGLDKEGQSIVPEPKCGSFFDYFKCLRSKPNPPMHPSLRNLPSRRASRRQSIAPNAYKARKDCFSTTYSKLVNNTTYKCLSLLFAVGALYTKDLTYCAMPATADWFMLNVVLSVIFFWLFLELVLYSLTHYGYGNTFFFWLDLIGTSSILIDIPWILLGIGLESNIFLIVKGGRMGRAARGASSMRFIKLLKMIRMIKLFRIVQFFRKKKNGEDDDSNKQERNNVDPESEVKPSKMGSLLADRVTQKVILGVLLSFLIIPLFDVGNVDDGAQTFMAVEDLEGLFSRHHNATNGELLASHAEDYQISLARFNAYHDEVLSLCVVSNLGDGYERVEIDAPDHSLRDDERQTYYTESGASKAILNARRSVMEEAILNICLTTFMISIFAIGSFIISIDTGLMVYPLEYLVIVLKRLTSIAVLSYDRKDHGFSQSDLFGSVMQSMTDIFYSGKREAVFIKVLEKQVQKVEENAMSVNMAPVIECDESEEESEEADDADDADVDVNDVTIEE